MELLFNILKFVLVVCIVLSVCCGFDLPLRSTFEKVFSLLLIVVASFYDISLAVILAALLMVSLLQNSMPKPIPQGYDSDSEPAPVTQKSSLQINSGVVNLHKNLGTVNSAYPAPMPYSEHPDVINDDVNKLPIVDYSNDLRKLEDEMKAISNVSEASLKQAQYDALLDASLEEKEDIDIYSEALQNGTILLPEMKVELT